MKKAKGTRARRQKEKEERKSAILEAAWGLFLEKGIVGTSMMDIARSCQLAKGTLYLYFKSKDEIAFTLLVKATHDLFLSLSSASDGEHPPLKQIEDIGMAYYQYFVHKPEAFRFMFIVPHESYGDKVDPSLIDEWGETGRAALAVVENLLKKANADGTIMAENPWETAVYLWSALTGVLSIPSQEVRQPFLGNINMENLFRIALVGLLKGLQK